MASGAKRTPRLPPDVRRRELLDATLDVLTEAGFGAVSIDAVARRAEVTRPVIYDLFGDLDGLLVALIDREEASALGPLLAIVGEDPDPGADPEQFLVDAVLGFLQAVRANPRTWRLVLMPPRGRSPELAERLRRSRRLIAERVAALLEWGIERRGGPSGLDLPLLSRLVVAAGEDAARLTLAHPRRYPPERLAGVVGAALAIVPASIRPRGTPAPQPPRAQTRPEAAVVADESRGRVPQAERREQLLDVALELIAEEGFDALTVEAIARRAQVNRVVVYRSFANLQILLLALLRREDGRTRTTLESLLPSDPGERTPAEVLGAALASFLAAVDREPQTWRVALTRPENAPLGLQKLVNARRAAFADRLRPMVEWALGGIDVPTSEIDVDILSRLLLSIGEEQGRLALDDSEFPPDRLMSSSWALLDALP